MLKANVGGIHIDIDEDVFIQEPEKWTHAVAEDLAKVENAYPMNENHRKIVNYIRDYFLEFGSAPPVRMLCKKTGFNLNYIHQLFPSGPAKGACKVAGLPKPTGCL